MIAFYQSTISRLTNRSFARTLLTAVLRSISDRPSSSQIAAPDTGHVIAAEPDPSQAKAEWHFDDCESIPQSLDIAGVKDGMLRFSLCELLLWHELSGAPKGEKAAYEHDLWAGDLSHN